MTQIEKNVREMAANLLDSIASAPDVELIMNTARFHAKAPDGATIDAYRRAISSIADELRAETQ